MKSSNVKARVLVSLGIAVFVCIILSITFIGRTKEETVKVGFIMSGSVDENGWNGTHYQAILNACKECGTQLLVKENIEEFTGQCVTAIEELVEEGANMIFLNSYGYSEEVSELVNEYPDVTFYANSSEYHAENMTSYFARMYQARYLTGIIAGMKTESDKIGYVAAMSNNEVNRGINAFTLGVKSVNKDATVVVTWTGSWDNEQAERQATRSLIEGAGVDVVTYHQNQSYVIQEAEAKEVFSIGYHKQFEGFSDKYLTSAVYNLEPVYRELVKEYMKGKGNSRTNYWIGIEKDAVGLSSYSDEVTAEARKAVDDAVAGMLGGDDVFSGVIYDTQGNLRCSENEIISDEILLEQLDWFVEGVEFYE